MARARVIAEIENPFSTGEDFASLFEENAANGPSEGSVVKGKVLAIEKDKVIIDIGYKTEGRVDLKDFPLSERDSISAGDELDVYVERVENANGEALLSRERAVREEAWERLEKLLAKEETVKGVIF